MICHWKALPKIQMFASNEHRQIPMSKESNLYRFTKRICTGSSRSESFQSNLYRFTKRICTGSSRSESFQSNLYRFISKICTGTDKADVVNTARQSQKWQEIYFLYLTLSHTTLSHVSILYLTLSHTILSYVSILYLTLSHTPIGWIFFPDF